MISQEKIYRPHRFGVEVRMSNGDTYNIDFNGFIDGNVTKELFNEIKNFDIDSLKVYFSDFFKKNDWFETDVAPNTRLFCNQVASFQVYH
ncbi:hypothetical protein [Lactococcus lactis]|uniref:hypothetical protein n=1 Tax=Lactococcus lactis TaxID=1358 RepID=UPI00223BB975|nr:hypothetical protein [Lactococcus lactis]MCT0449652.1 hypothetical protein [Lactococcus lactis subsp. lactis]